MKQKLTISQVLLYYDFPQIVVARDAVDTRFLAMLIKAENEALVFLAISISINRLSSFINGKIDLREIFVSPELNQYYTFNYNDENIEAELWTEDQIPEEFLPDGGFFLNQKSSNEAIVREAFEKNNAIVHLSISDNDNSNSIAADSLGEVLKYYQLTIENVFKKKVSQSSSPHKAIYSMPNNYKLRAFAASPGSLNIHLFSNAQTDIFGNSIIDVALRQFDELIGHNSDENLLVVLRSLKGHSISSLKNLLNKIINLDVRIKHKWYAPDQKDVHVVTIDKERAVHITSILSSVEELTEEIKSFSGHFTQVDIKGTWRIRNDEDGKEYSGSCDNTELLDGVTINNVQYKIVCNELIEELKVTEKEKVKYILLSIEVIDNT